MSLQLVNPVDDSALAQFDDEALIGELASKLGFNLANELPSDYLTVNFVGAPLVEKLNALLPRIDTLFPGSSHMESREVPLREVDQNLLRYVPHTSFSKDGIEYERIEQSTTVPDPEAAALRADVEKLIAFFEQANNHVLKNSDYLAKVATA